MCYTTKAKEHEVDLSGGMQMEGLQICLLQEQPAVVSTILGGLFDLLDIDGDIDMDGDLPWLACFVHYRSFITVFGGLGCLAPMQCHPVSHCVRLPFWGDWSVFSFTGLLSSRSARRKTPVHRPKTTWWDWRRPSFPPFMKTGLAPSPILLKETGTTPLPSMQTGKASPKERKWSFATSKTTSIL